MKTTILTLAALALSAAAPAALAKAPDPAAARWDAESRWVREVERRLNRAFEIPDMSARREQTAEVQFELDEAGMIREPVLKTQSGMALLDEAALRAVTRVRSLRPPPPSLVGRPIVFQAKLTPPKPGRLGPS